ncbi:MAG TPA: hypothetical protein VGI73_14135 [Solirubrobacterales bacterium]|jgi:hypothetical protein
MSILDDAIREHLELKRAHGADEAELKKLEDEAFGPAERPDQAGEQIDPFAEAPTEFLATPGADAEAAAEEAGRRRINVADLQEPPPPKEVEPEESAEDAAVEGPDEEQHPAMEHRTVAEPASEDRPAEPTDQLRPDPEAPSAEERDAIADQPTQLFDVEGQFEDTAESASPSDEQLIDAERSEPRLGPVDDPLAELEESGHEVEVTGPDREEPEDEFDEFFSEQRLSDELNQALEAPLPDEPGAPSTEESFAPFIDSDTELRPLPEEESDEHDLPADAEEDSREHELPEDSAEHDLPDEPRKGEDAGDEYKAEPGHADALEDTPEFLEDQPEDDDAWFEQRPPKDFDFGD